MSMYLVLDLEDVYTLFLIWKMSMYLVLDLEDVYIIPCFFYLENVHLPCS